MNESRAILLSMIKRLEHSLTVNAETGHLNKQRLIATIKRHRAKLATL